MAHPLYMNVCIFFHIFHRPMLAYGSFIWWRGITIAQNCKRLNHLQRTICLAITGAARTAPQLALEALLYLPRLEFYIRAEARTTALRLQSQIKRRYSWRQDHSSIIEEVYGNCQMLRAPVDYQLPIYIFDRPFRADNPMLGAGTGEGGADYPQFDRWFTETAVINNNFGFGIFNPNTGRSYCGPLGIDAEETQANLAAILECCVRIKKANIGNQPIQILTSSLGAIKALRCHKIESKQVLDCVEILMEIAQRRHLTIAWTHSANENECFEKANVLAKVGASRTPFGPGPFFPITDRKKRILCQEWATETMVRSWHNVTDCNHTKSFVIAPNTKLTKQLLDLDKAKVSIVVSLITGHVRLNKHMHVLGIRDDPDCDRCGGGAETAMHFLCTCSGYGDLRRTIFGNERLIASETITSNLSRIFAFAQRSGRFPVLGSAPTNRHFSLYRPGGRNAGNNAAPPTPPGPPQQTIG